MNNSNYDSITDLENYIGTYHIRAVRHLDEDYKKITNKGVIKLTKEGMELRTDLDSLHFYKSYHNRLERELISKGNFAFHGLNKNDVTLLIFDEKKRLLVFSYTEIDEILTTIFVYKKKE